MLVGVSCWPERGRPLLGPWRGGNAFGWWYGGRGATETVVGEVLCGVLGFVAAWTGQNGGGRQMKHIETVIRTYSSVSGITCDICGACSDRSEWDDISDGFLDGHNTATVTVLYKTVWSWSGVYGSGTQVDVDICPGCFWSKLVPWLESQGVKIRVEDWKG